MMCDVFHKYLCVWVVDMAPNRHPVVADFDGVVGELVLFAAFPTA
jgi:hypothetical protein